MALALYGATGIGKSTTLFKFLSDKGRKVLFARSLEDLAEFSDETDIIFDDISFSYTRPELLLHLCDKCFHSSVRILRNSVKIPGSVKKWFTHNNKDNWEPILATVEQQEAINRRITVKYVTNRKEIKQAIIDFLDSDDS